MTKTLAVIGLLVGLFYLPTLLSIQTNDTEIGSYGRCVDETTGEPIVCEYIHSTESTTDIDGYNLGEEKGRGLFVFISNPLSAINTARQETGDIIGDWTYDTVVKPITDLGDTIVTGVKDSINGLWLDIRQLGLDVLDALSFWN